MEGGTVEVANTLIHPFDKLLSQVHGFQLFFQVSQVHSDVKW